MEYTYSAWIEHEPDSDGYCVLSKVLASIKEKNIPLFSFEWTSRPEWWSDLQQILEGILAFEWWVDRGYLKFKCSNDKGVYEYPCDSTEFERFAHRLIERKPMTFEEFEEEM